MGAPLLERLKQLTGMMDELVQSFAELGWTVDIRVVELRGHVVSTGIWDETGTTFLRDPTGTMLVAPTETMLVPKQSVAPTKVKEMVGASVLRLIQAKADAAGTCDKEQVYKDGVKAGLSRQQIGQRLRSLRTGGQIKVSLTRIFLVR